VTEGLCELMPGEKDEAPLLPVLPVEKLPLLPVSPDEPVVPVVPPVDWPEVVAPAALFPGCSCATTMPMPTVAPVAANRAALVRVRRRARAWSLLAPALGSLWDDISLSWSLVGAPSWDHVDIGPVAKPPVGPL